MTLASTTFVGNDLDISNHHMSHHGAYKSMQLSNLTPKEVTINQKIQVHKNTIKALHQ